MDKLIESNIVCPISQEIFYEPVLADDGFVYEKMEIEKWFSLNKSSPVLRKPVASTRLIPQPFVKSIVTSYLQLNPDKRGEQYKPDFRHKHNVATINDIFRRRSYSELLLYKNFRPKLSKFYHLKQFILCASQTIIKHYIDYCIDLEYKYANGMRLIHIIVLRGDLELVKYMLEQIDDIDCQNVEGLTPLHLAVIKNSHQIIEYLVNSGANVNIKDKYGARIGNYCQSFSDRKTMEFLIKHGAKMSTKHISKKSISLLYYKYYRNFMDDSDSDSGSD